MDAGALLERAIGEAGRPGAVEPFGEGAIARFSVDSGPNAGEWFVDTSGQAVAKETGFVVSGKRGTVARIWRHPLDPRLPALRTAVDPERIARIAAARGSTGEIEASILAYRPGRRAVVRLTQQGVDLFVKVVRPGEAEGLAGIHDACRRAGVPAPLVEHWSPSGVVVVRDADGVAGPAAAARMQPDALLDAVDDLRTSFAGIRTKRPARPSVAARADWHLQRIQALLPNRADDVAALAAAIGGQLQQKSKRVTVHGDLHIGQLFFDLGAVSSVIDVDTTGLGDPADDTAAFIGHAAGSAARNEAAGRSSDSTVLRQLATAASARWMRDDHSRALTALHLVGHGIRAADRRPETAGRLLDEALETARA